MVKRPPQPDTPSVEHLLAAGRFQEVCRHFERATPVSAEQWLSLARAQMGLGSVEDALDCFRHGLELDPSSLGLKYYRACALARRGQWQAVEDSLAECLGEEPWRDRAFSTRAQARVRAGLWAEAVEDYLELRRRNRLSPHDRLGLAACLVQLRRCEEAEGVLDELLGAGRGSLVAWLLKGRCLEGQRRWADAAEAYRLGLKQYPESRELSKRLLATGRRPSARHNLRRLAFSTGVWAHPSGMFR